MNPADVLFGALLMSLGCTSLAVSCPSGSFGVPGSNNCFRVIEGLYTWEQAWGRCSREGLVLARPDDSIAVALRKNLLDTYGEGYGPWVSARGSGSGWSWRDGPLAADPGGDGSVDQALVDPLYWSEDSTSDCMLLLLSKAALADAPTAPYGTGDCQVQHINYNISLWPEYPVLCQGENGWGQWSSWGTCTRNCGGGEQTRSRTCKGGACLAAGTDFQTRICNTAYCPVHGGWSSWSLPSPCSKSCGKGEHQRSRTCTHPPPVHNGRHCVGIDRETLPCNIAPCLIEAEEPSVCQHFNTEDCTRSSVAADCPKTCSQTEEPRVCRHFNAEDCTRSSVAAECPQTCSQTEEPSVCRHFDAEDCTRSSVAAECPLTCSQKEPSLCKHFDTEDCTRSSVAAKCPQTCSQNLATTHPATSKPFSEAPNTAIDKCGISKSFDERIASGSPDITEKIVGGQESIAGKYPWMIHLSFYSSDLDDTVHCGGSLVSKRYVLTAAHCIRYLKRNIPVYVYIGFVNLKQREPQSELFSVYLDDISIHNEFNNSTLKNDIALARLPQDLEYNALVHPICIGGPTHIPFGGKAVAAGWGLINPTDTEIPDIIREVELNVLPESSCANPRYFICTSAPNKDTCKGDSGGPLMVQQGGQWYIIGIVSHGPSNCGSSNLPGVYTRISSFLPFIQSRI